MTLLSFCGRLVSLVASLPGYWFVWELTLNHIGGTHTNVRKIFYVIVLYLLGEFQSDEIDEILIQIGKIATPRA